MNIHTNKEKRGSIDMDIMDYSSFINILDNVNDSVECYRCVWAEMYREKKTPNDLNY